MATSLAWTGDDETLAQNTDVYGQVFGGQTQGLKGQMKSASKAKVASDKATAAATKEQEGIEQKSATTNMIMGIAETGGQLAMAGAFKGKGPGAKSAALSDKSLALEHKASKALEAGNVARATRLTGRAEKLAGRAGNIGSNLPATGQTEEEKRLALVEQYRQ